MIFSEENTEEIEVEDEDTALDDEVLDEVAGTEASEESEEDVDGFGLVDEEEEEEEEEENEYDDDEESLEDDAEDVDYDTFDDIDER